MIYITGDTHGTRDFYKLLDDRFKNLTKKDYILICGDCGVLFDPVKSNHMINLYTYLPYTVLFIDGNHENYDMLAEYAVSNWNGGKVQFISDSIIHLMRGQVYSIEENTFFTFGGALSYDKDRRSPHESWWPQEIPTFEEYEEALENLSKVNNTVDYVITHDCPTCWSYMVSDSSKVQHHGFLISDVNNYLEELKKAIHFKHWYFGHYHLDKNYDDVTALYNKILKLEG